MIAYDSHETTPLPSAADLDAVADEQRIRESASTPLVDWEPDSLCECGHTKFWHSLASDRWIPADSGCLAGHPCRCPKFAEAAHNPAQLPALPEETGFEGENCAYVTAAHVGITADHMRRFLGCLKTMGVELALSRRAQPQDASETVTWRVDGGWKARPDGPYHSYLMANEEAAHEFAESWKAAQMPGPLSERWANVIEITTTERIVAQRKAGA